MACPPLPLSAEDGGHGAKSAPLPTLQERRYRNRLKNGLVDCCGGGCGRGCSCTCCCGGSCCGGGRGAACFCCGGRFCCAGGGAGFGGSGCALTMVCSGPLQSVSQIS